VRSNLPPIYPLTGLTRTASEQRRVIIQGFDLRWRTFVIIAGSSPAAVMVTAIAWTVVGQAAIFCMVIVPAVVYALVERRTRSGLQLRTYQHLVDRRRTGVGQFYICGQPFDPSALRWGRIAFSNVPAAAWKGGWP
jgi:hypothetical protein